MRAVRLTAVSLIFAAIFAVSAFAQTAGKIGYININAFDDKDGIAKYVAALNSLDAEFKQTGIDLQTLQTKIQTLEKEIKDLQAKAQTNVPIDKNAVNAKLEEYEKLTREYKFKQEDAKARFESRQAAVLGPIRLDIGNAIQEFTKKNGYVMIFDITKLNQAILGLDETADVTKQFITYYNARPATTAVVPK